MSKHAMIGIHKSHAGKPGGMMIRTRASRIPSMYSYEFRQRLLRAADLIINKPPRPKP